MELLKASSLTGSYLPKQTGQGLLVIITVQYVTLSFSRYTELTNPFCLKGTWAFMAADALDGDIIFQHNIGHDLESLFYVSLYCSIRWLPVTPKIDIGEFMLDFFDASFTMKGNIVGGKSKRLYRIDQKFSIHFIFVNKAIQEFFKAGYAYLRSVMPSESDEVKTTKKQRDFATLRELFQTVLKGDLDIADRAENVEKDFQDDTNASLANEPTRASSANWASSQYSIRQEADDVLDDNNPRLTKHRRGEK